MTYFSITGFCNDSIISNKWPLNMSVVSLAGHFNTGFSKTCLCILSISSIIRVSVVIYSDFCDLRRGGRSHFLSSGQSWLHYVLHVRRREKAPYAVPVEFGVQPERKRLRLAWERRGMYATYTGPADVQTIS